MTRIVGLVSWWDESPVWLAAALTSLGRFCDHVVVLDGRYAMFPDRRLQSGTAEMYAVIEATRAAGVGVTLRTAPHTYVDEMEKRSMLFRLAAVEAVAHSDWYFILDGDEVVIEAPPKDELVARLDAAAAEGQWVLTSTLFEKTDPHQDEQRSELGSKLPLEWRYECATPRFWRVLSDMRVVGYHYNYVGEDEHGATLEVWGHDGISGRDTAWWGSLCGQVIIENRNRLRGIQRDADRQAYYDSRDATGLETIAPLMELQKGARDGA